MEEPDGQKVALGHVLHVRCELAPNLRDEVPAGQAVQLVMLVSAFASENVPVGHILHAVMFSAAKADDHVPAGHGDAANGVEQKYPCGHTKQVALEVDAIAVEYVPAWHAVQICAVAPPTVLDQVPAGHGVALLLPDLEQK